MKQSSLGLFGILAAVALISVISTQQAYAHGNISYDVHMHGDEMRQFQIVLGHTSEPTFGLDFKNMVNGVHHVDIQVRDKATKLPISGAQLKVDKYYFKDKKGFDKAENVNKADAIEKGVPVSSVFGDPGKYIVRQVLTNGIYGYHVFGTVKYFDGTTVPVDFTAFCSDAGSKFNTPGFTGGYGCVNDINDIKFPKKGHKGNSD